MTSPDLIKKTVQNKQDVFSWIGGKYEKGEGEDDNAADESVTGNNLLYSARMSDAIYAFVVVSLSSSQTKNQTQKQFKTYSKLCHDFLRNLGDHLRISKIWHPNVVGGGGRERGSLADEHPPETNEARSSSVSSSRRESIFKSRPSDRISSTTASVASETAVKPLPKLSDATEREFQQEEDFFDSVKSFFVSIFSPDSKRKKKNSSSAKDSPPNAEVKTPPVAPRSPMLLKSPMIRRRSSGGGRGGTGTNLGVGAGFGAGAGVGSGGEQRRRVQENRTAPISYRARARQSSNDSGMGSPAEHFFLGSNLASSVEN